MKPIINPNQINFWLALDRLVQEHELIIDRPRGTAHPKFPDFIYPFDYGYLQDTTAMDGHGIDVWRGTANTGIDGIIVAVDMDKKNSEIKLLFNCSAEEKNIILAAQNIGEMHAILINRSKNKQKKKDNREDRYFSALADARDAEKAPLISHEDAWK